MQIRWHLSCPWQACRDALRMCWKRLWHMWRHEHWYSAQPKCFKYLGNWAVLDPSPDVQRPMSYDPMSYDIYAPVGIA